MLDIFHDVKTLENSWIFQGTASAARASNAMWTKPRGIKMVHILCAGHGGIGVTATAGATSAGGAGGGSGGQTHVLIPAAFLPDVLYVAAGNGTVANIATWVSVRPCAAYNAIPAASDLLCYANGANGTTAGAVATSSAAILMGKGVFQALAGIAGGTAGAATPTAGGAVGANTSGLMLSGGGGGGGMSAAATTAGGAAATTAPPNPYPIPQGGAGGSSGVDGGRGQNGYVDWNSMIFTGGGGGGSGFPTATTSNSGGGGDGAPGCGGGGGGGVITGKTAGAGGKGGPGFVIITCW